jgi:hypothetical protein
MKKASSVILFVFLLSSSGCKFLSDNTGASASDNSIPGVPGSVKPGAPESIPSRDFLFEGMLPEKGYGAYGYFLFTKRPDVHSRNRFIKVASAYLGVLEHTDEFSSVPRERLMPTYWLLKTEASEIALQNMPSPELLVDFYDYSRAKALLSRIEKNDSEGPVLVAWRQPFERRGDISTALVFDLSTFSDDDMERSIQIWTSRIVKDPELWNKGFKMVKFREEFRNFLQRYGEQVLAVVNIRD